MLLLSSKKIIVLFFVFLYRKCLKSKKEKIKHRKRGRSFRVLIMMTDKYVLQLFKLKRSLTKESEIIKANAKLRKKDYFNERIVEKGVKYVC